MNSNSNVMVPGFVLLTAFIATDANAAAADGAAFEALNVAASVVSSSSKARVLRKSVGGLICDKVIQLVNPSPAPNINTVKGKFAPTSSQPQPPIYGCRLAQNVSTDPVAIYQAIPAAPTSLPSHAGTLSVSKKAGNVNCQKTAIFDSRISPSVENSFKCSIVP